jgi:hypothetical protein
MESERPEREELPQSRPFLVGLTIWGALFTTGLFVVFQNFDWGLFYTLSGLCGLSVLIRDRLRIPLIRRSRPSLQTIMSIFASVVISIFVGHTISQIVSVQTAFTQYVLPRSLTEKQASEVRDFLSHHKPYSVTVKANPLDSEAMGYAGQLFNALHATDWTAVLDTSDQGPGVANPGLCIDEIGQSSRPKFDAKDIPAETLQQAFQAANVEVNCGGGSGGGDYKIYLLVGHRPLIMNAQEPALRRLGNWIASLD